LQRAVRQRPEMQIAFGIPLDTGRCALEVALPGVVIGMQSADVMRQAGMT
jgi:hypothetical protein